MVKSYWIQYDEENDCYSVDIDTGTYCINYPKAKVVFSNNNIMVMPISISVLNNEMEVVNEYTLTPIKKTE